MEAKKEDGDSKDLKSIERLRSRFRYLTDTPSNPSAEPGPPFNPTHPRTQRPSLVKASPVERSRSHQPLQMLDLVQNTATITCPVSVLLA